MKKCPIDQKHIVKEVKCYTFSYHFCTICKEDVNHLAKNMPKEAKLEEKLSLLDIIQREFNEGMCEAKLKIKANISYFDLEKIEFKLYNRDNNEEVKYSSLSLHDKNEINTSFDFLLRKYKQEIINQKKI